VIGAAHLHPGQDLDRASCAARPSARSPSKTQPGISRQSGGAPYRGAIVFWQASFDHFETVIHWALAQAVGPSDLTQEIR